MPCERYGPVVLCRPNRLVGLGEAANLFCRNCRRAQRHWLHITNDAWYDPEHVWLCDTCGHSRRDSQASRRVPPILPEQMEAWKVAVHVMVQHSFPRETA